MRLSNVEIKQLICDQCDVYNPVFIVILDREKIAPPQKDVVDFIKALPSYAGIECEDAALEVLYFANKRGWAHGTVTGHRVKQNDEHTMLIFIDDKNKVRIYDPTTKMYAVYLFEIHNVMMY